MLPLLIALLVTGVYTSGIHRDPEEHMNAHQLITSKGYPAQDHWVTTEDGYILGLQRIPYGLNSKTRTSLPVVLLQHGILGCSTNWLTNLANESLAYILADAGWDVWLGNARGNTYSRNHTSLKPSHKEFWNFTFDEHALKDLPAMVNYILSVTGKTQLSYVGHSQGTTMGFAGFSTLPDLADKVNLFVALAPVATVHHIKGALSFIAGYYKELDLLFTLFGDGEFLPDDDFNKILARAVCPLPGVDDICGNLLFLVCGFDKKNMNFSRIPVYAAHNPAGTSVKDVVHYAQEVRSGKFSMYDYGSASANKAHYGQATPPNYDVTKMTVATATFNGGNDWLADPTDVSELLPKLSHHVYHHNIDYYEHLDFIWGLNANVKLYPRVIDELNKYKV
ncbi:gastric triacylglycerol lipase-like [Dysidea avara]|uniref:gastric triacylglycerol lipase-like n=1 Tax=Dysidea avara TaxID=196820 RepID=UPI003317FD50